MLLTILQLYVYFNYEPFKISIDLITKNHFFIVKSCFRLTTILMLFLLKNAL